MGILESAVPVIVICTRDRGRATTFYRDVLGLSFVHEDAFASVFHVGGIALRLSAVPDFAPHEHTILGFRVPDVRASVLALRENGVTFNRYAHVKQDALGICTLGKGAIQVAWLSDPDGNVLSITNV